MTVLLGIISAIGGKQAYFLYLPFWTSATPVYRFDA